MVTKSKLLLVRQGCLKSDSFLPVIGILLAHKTHLYKILGFLIFFPIIESNSVLKHNFHSVLILQISKYTFFVPQRPCWYLWLTFSSCLILNLEDAQCLFHRLKVICYPSIDSYTYFWYLNSNKDTVVSFPTPRMHRMDQISNTSGTTWVSYNVTQSWNYLPRVIMRSHVLVVQDFPWHSYQYNYQLVTYTSYEFGVFLSPL